MEEKIIIISKRIVLFSSIIIVIMLCILTFQNKYLSGYNAGWQQISLQGLSRIDRCVSCHPDSTFETDHAGMVMIQAHETDEFGCTICHQGVGRAVDSLTAHLSLTPVNYLQSSCVPCHFVFFNPSYRTDGCDLIFNGKKILYKNGCLGCHKLKKVGGSAAPDLTFFSEKPYTQLNYSHVEADHSVYSWLREHFENPQKISPGSQMFGYALSDDDINSLVNLICGLKNNNFMPDYLDLEVLKELKGKRFELSGEKLFGLLCSSCHGLRRKNKSYPIIFSEGFLSVASVDYLDFILTEGRGNRPMKSWLPQFSGLKYDELQSLRDYIRNARFPAHDFTEISNITANRDRGEKIFLERCAFCHGDDKGGPIGPAILTSDFLSIASDAFIYRTLINGRDNTAMPSWSQLTMNDLKCLLSYMRNYAPYNYSINTETDIQGDIDKGKEKFHYLCSRCHGKEGWGEIAPAILNPAFLTSAPASFILQTIKNGRTHSAMFGWEKDVAGYGRQTLKSITNITAFMMSRKDSIPSRIYPGMNLGIPREGRSLFSKKCSTCHGNNGEGLKAPALNNQELLNAASNGFLIATLVLGREGTEMPVWSKSGKNRPALTAEEICHIVAYIRSWQTMTIYLNRL